MVATAARHKKAFLGRWRIVSMSMWDKEYLDEEVPAFIEFKPKQTGQFQFGYVQGQMDYRAGSRDGKHCVEFSWDGADTGGGDMNISGRGWAVVEGNRLHGRIFIHLGDESDFVARRAKGTGAKE